VIVAVPEGEPFRFLVLREIGRPETEMELEVTDKLPSLAVMVLDPAVFKVMVNVLVPETRFAAVGSVAPLSDEVMVIVEV
jgi:hypothetical protein